MHDFFSIEDHLSFATISFQTDGNKVSMLSDKGFDDFVNTLESNPLSKNPKFYGSFHNTGHVSMGVCISLSFREVMTIFCIDRE